MGRRQTIQELMKAANISQDELGAKLGKSQSAVSQMLNRKGNPTLKTIREIADALCVDISKVAAHYDIWSNDRGGDDEN
ncbi:helix-turn-helix domain-containing protein [Chamaesiphon minutus]|uniref:helix-turn-helix domain-containing protein n=1 Tax=Chamaesiphon minutus TaxID=1173032 RepID=UPI0022B6730F|nr:helix-turn-helix transcriptional regulator [Chamaesiphon minutus]